MNIPVVNDELLNIMPSLEERKDKHVAIIDAMKILRRINLSQIQRKLPLKIKVTARQEPVLYNVLKRNSVYAMTRKNVWH